MKKTAIFCLTALMGVAFTGCDNYEEPNPAPQTNPQPAILQTSDISFASDVTDEVYSLEQLNNDNDSLLLATVTTDKLAAGYDLVAKVQISANGFQRSGEFETTLVQDPANPSAYRVLVAPDALQGAYVSGISKGPRPKAIEARMLLVTKKGDQVAQIGGPENFYGPVQLTVQPFASSLVIEDNYYLIGTACDWDMTRAIKLNHSDASPYDDPVFSAKFDVNGDGGWWWKIVPESTFSTGNWVDAANASYGVAENGDSALEGMLVGRTDTEDCGAGSLNVSGPYLLTINMEDLTYSFTLAIEQLYTPGNSNGWNQGASQILTTSNYSDYSGFAHLNGEFKFTSAPNWDGINYGDGGADGVLSTDGGAGNINAGADGLYWCKVNIASLSYSLAVCNSFGVIGDAVGSWDNDVVLTPSADFLTWTGTVHFAATGEFKFRANGGWDINVGGAINNLTFDAANIATPGEGNYEVVLDFSTVPYAATLTKK